MDRRDGKNIFVDALSKRCIFALSIDFVFAM